MSKIKNLLDLILEEEAPAVKYATGLDWLDRHFDGGFEMGQLMAILGDAEAGKTQLINQILGNVGVGHKCLYFALEFNKRKIKRYFEYKLEQGTITKQALNNIYIVTQDIIDAEIDNIAKLIEKGAEQGIKFVAIDSTMMLYADGLTGENETTEIFRKLHEIANKMDILLFVITQSSKEDNKSKRVSIFGSQKANHFCDVILYISTERDNNTNEIKKRNLIIQKNKQTGNYANVELEFNKEKLEFAEAGKRNENEW